MSEKVDAILAHHGVKGMRWGVRNEPGKGGRRKVSRVGERKSKSSVEPTQSNKNFTKNFLKATLLGPMAVDYSSPENQQKLSTGQKVVTGLIGGGGLVLLTIGTIKGWWK